MIAFLSAEQLGALGLDECTPTHRVRNQLRVNHVSRDTAPADPRLRTDLKNLVARLQRVRARGGAFAQVEMSPHVEESARSLKMVGSEMITLPADRRGS